MLHQTFLTALNKVCTKRVFYYSLFVFSLFVCMLGMMTLLLLYFPTIFHFYVYAFFMLFCVEIFALSQWFLDTIILYVHSISISRFLMFIIYLLKLIVSNIKMNLFIYFWISLFLFYCINFIHLLYLLQVYSFIVHLFILLYIVSFYCLVLVLLFICLFIYLFIFLFSYLFIYFLPLILLLFPT